MAQHLGSRANQKNFAHNTVPNIARSVFDRSFAMKGTYDFDKLYPIFWDQMYPGDSCTLNVKHFTRLATQVVPLMDNMYMDFFFFFVPYRLVWDNFQKFMGEQENPGDSIDYLIPQVPITKAKAVEGSIFDKFGLPIFGPQWVGDNDMLVNSLNFRAYNLIWNYWFRDQNLNNSVFVPKDDGPDNVNDFVILPFAKKHDYFTSALASPQKGAAVQFPIAGTAPVTGSIFGPISEVNLPYKNTITGSYAELQAGANSTSGAAQFATATSSTIGNLISSFIPADGLNMNYVLTADLASATAITMNQFRQAMTMQTFLERDNRGGTRYREVVKSHFNIDIEDFRVQYPEHLGNATTMINQHVVAQTSETGNTPQANVAAFSTANESGNRIGFSKAFREHGVVLGLMRLRADVTYQQGIERHWSQRTRFDMFFPEFQQLGEQAILRQEIFFQGNASDKQAWGFQERHAEFRYRPSIITGQFRSSYAQTLDVWHLAEEFEGPPSLNATFIQSRTPMERSLAVAEGYPAILSDFWFQYRHERPMVAYPTPAGLGRF